MTESGNAPAQTPPARKKISATVIADSVSRYGDRITTLELTFPRFLLPELNTHRAFSRNSASSRARSVKKTIQEVRDDPFVPVHWPSERPGMAGGAEITDPRVVDKLRGSWWLASGTAVERATKLVAAGVHKSLVNRILEPFMWHTVVVTATDWDGFFAQRLALLEDGTPAAELHFFDLAQAMETALALSQPRELRADDWHLPYVTDPQLEDIANTAEYGPNWLSYAIRASVARCAGVSYLNQGTDRPLERDLALYYRLRGADPPHWSPFEHVARPVVGQVEQSLSWLGVPQRYNLTGWESLRWLLESGARLEEV